MVRKHGADSHVLAASEQQSLKFHLTPWLNQVSFNTEPEVTTGPGSVDACSLCLNHESVINEH
jgi:hypothetical protein